MVERKCKQCGATFHAREADVKRGWGRFCSKSCKAKHQENRTGQYRKLQARGRRIRRPDESSDLVVQDYSHPFESGPDGHGQW